MQAASRPAERGRAAATGAWLRSPAVVCLAAAACVSALISIKLGSHLILFDDDWSMVLQRRGLSAHNLFYPHGEHLVVSAVAIYNLLLATFGLTSPVPFHVVSTVVYLLAAVLLFAYMRRRVGDWLALLGTMVILFFGASALDFLLPFAIVYSGAIAAGLAALLALDRDDRRGDAVACALLVVSISFGELGIAFAVGILVRMALAPRRLVSRLYVVGVPLTLYALWWLGWGHFARSHLSLHNVAAAPAFVLDAVAAAIGPLLGIIGSGDQQSTPVDQQWAPGVLVVAVALAAWRVRRLGGVPRGVWPVLAIGMTFWVLAAFNTTDFRPPDTARYLYPSGVFLLLIASELLRAVRPSGRAILAVAVVVVISVAANLDFLVHRQHAFNYYWWKRESQISQAQLRALEVAGPLNQSFELNLGLHSEIDTDLYLSAVEAFGSPAYTDSELASSPERARLAADQVLGAILGFKLRPGGSVGGSCRTVRASPAGSSGLDLAPGRVSMKGSGSTRADVKLGRFSDQLPIDAGALGPESNASLTIPVDGSTRPWRLGFQGEGPITVCGPSVAGRL